MSGFRLNTSLWVSAHLQQCDIDFMPAMIICKGDNERGLIIIKHHIIGQGVKIYKLGYDLEGGAIWRYPLGDDLLEEQKADHYIGRERKFDEDIWVIEIEDVKALYELPSF